MASSLLDMVNKALANLGQQPIVNLDRKYYKRIKTKIKQLRINSNGSVLFIL